MSRNWDTKLASLKIKLLQIQHGVLKFMIIREVLFLQVQPMLLQIKAKLQLYTINIDLLSNAQQIQVGMNVYDVVIQQIFVQMQKLQIITIVIVNIIYILKNVQQNQRCGL
ncbi:unnamed protein product [Paramecium octaurelia]|uniref:Uncharacterized protein n=1 Tax=Paramecium octaurelia TaxID=43137 RepID=A0A8S1W7A9_PAROT|nr:unnamed protein product [Paramecium octaurelia]